MSIFGQLCHLGDVASLFIFSSLVPGDVIHIKYVTGDDHSSRIFFYQWVWLVAIDIELHHWAM